MGYGGGTTPKGSAMASRVVLPYFFLMNSLSILGYCWKDHLQAGYLKWHDPILKLIGVDTTVTHLALKVNEWVVHPFQDNDIKWMKERVSDRCFGKPCQEIYIGHTHKELHDLIEVSKQQETKTWSCYAWFYTCGLYTNKLDCVSFTRSMLEYTHNIRIKCQTPTCLLKELQNNGYGISRVG